MNIILLGPSGSGKGVQAKLLVEKFGLDYVVMGDLLRKAAQERQDIKEIIGQGKLISGEITFSLLKERFVNKAPQNILLDGFPRTLEQYDIFFPWLMEVGGKFDLVIVLKVSDEELIKRLSARRLDPVTGKIYNLVTDKPPAGVDINYLVQREDDELEAIGKRLGWYHESVEPLIEVLKKDVKVVEIDGDRPIEEIHIDLVNLVEGLRNAG